MKHLILALAVLCLSHDALAGGRRQAERAWNVEIELVRHELGSWYWLADDLSLARSLWTEGHTEQAQAVLASLDAALARDRARIAESLGEAPLVSLDRALATFHQERIAVATPDGASPLGRIGLRGREGEEDDEDDEEKRREREPRREIERQQDSAPDPTERLPLPRPTER